MGEATVGLDGHNRGERLSSNGSEESGKSTGALLDKGRDVTANGAKGCRARATLKTARNLLLEFEHPKVAFGQIVVERHTEIVGKAQHVSLIAIQPFDQRPYLALRWSAACALRPATGRGRVGFQTSGDDLAVERIYRCLPRSWHKGQ